MQESFKASHDIITPVVDEVVKAMIRREAIVIVEYANYEPTHPEIMQHILGYDRQTTIHKEFDGGGEELTRTLWGHRFNTNRLRFCGVNTCYCVKETMVGVYSMIGDANYELLTKSTACTCSANCLNWYKRTTRITKVRLIEET